MFVCSILYIFFEMTGLLVAHCKGKNEQGVCQKPIVYTVVILGSLTCGSGASMIWVFEMICRWLKGRIQVK